MKYLDRQMLHLDMFYTDILIIYGDEDHTRKTLQKYFDEEEVNEMLKGFNFKTKGRTMPTKFGSPLIWIPKIPETAQDVGFLVHELFHSTCAVMGNVGIDFSNESEEAFAYMIGFMTEKVLEELPTFSCPSPQQ